jgi:peptidoglycan/xylan/chitin deacetylase (PgdA/CDA1 family)
MPATIFLTTDFIGRRKIFWFLKVAMLMRDGNLSAESINEILDGVTADNPESESAQRLKADDVPAMYGDTDQFTEYLKQLEPDIAEIIIEEMEKAGSRSGDPVSGENMVINWEEVGLMMSRDIDIGSHGCSHKIMTKLNSDEIRRELVNSKKLLEEKTDKEITLLAYPNGDHDSRVRQLAGKTGYTGAVTTGCSKPDASLDLYALPRIGVHDGMSVGVSGEFSKAVFAFSLSHLSCLMKRR